MVFWKTLLIKMRGEDMYKRRNYFIDKKFQTKFILKFCLLVIATGAFIMMVLYAFAGKATTVSFVNSRVVAQGAADFLVPLLLQTFVVSTIIVGMATIIIALFASHRIAGPLYRFKKILGSLGEGDFLISCKIRLKDSPQDVALAFSEMIAKVRKNLNLIDGDLKNLKEKLEGEDLKEIKKSVSEVDKALHHFKF